jgi:hypothetical protein
MRFSPRSLLAWIAVAIAGADPLCRDAAPGLPLSDLAEAGRDDRPAEHTSPGG